MDRQEAFKAKITTQQPAYEIWFSVVIDPASQRAIWVRYSRIISSDQRPAIGVMWASFYDVNAPQKHCYGTVTFPFNEIVDQHQTYIYPQGSIALDKNQGTLTTNKGDLSWELNYQHQHAPFDYTPNFLKNPFLSGFVKSRSLVCSPFARVDGKVKLNEQSYYFNNATGLLTHIWGTKRIEQLSWIFVPKFDNDDRYSLEIVTVKPNQLLPTFIIIKLINNGQLESDLSLRSILSGKVQFNYPYIDIQARSRKTRLSLKAKLDINQSTPYIYRDPDSKPLYIEHSDVGEVRCHINDSGLEKELVCHKMAAVEFHGLTPWSNIEYLDPYR